MTGVAADADDLVQETFLRAIERPPARHRQRAAAVARPRGHEPRRAISSAAPAARARSAPGCRRRSRPATRLAGVRAAGDAEGRYDLLESVHVRVPAGARSAHAAAARRAPPARRLRLLGRRDRRGARPACAERQDHAPSRPPRHDAIRRPPPADRRAICRRPRRHALSRFMGALLQRRRRRTIEAVLAPDVDDPHRRRRRVPRRPQAGRRPRPRGASSTAAWPRNARPTSAWRCAC